MPDSKTGKPRQMGDAQARKIEKVFEKPPGWMDNDPSYDYVITQGGVTTVIEAKEPMAPGTLHHALELVGRHLRLVPADRREALGRNLQGWALEGGPHHYVALIESLLNVHPHQPHAKGES